MKWKNLIKVALKSIFKNKMRTLLTMLGIIIGVTAVIVMVAIGQGAEQRIQNQISSLGTNLIMVFPSAARQGGVSMGAATGAQLTMEDVERLKKEGTQLLAISPVVRSGAQVIGGTGNWNTSCYGTSEEYLTIRQWDLASGDFFGESDIRARSKVCVIGATVAKNLFPGDDPVGQPLRVRNVPFKIVGVLKERGQDTFGHDQDDVIIAPYTTVLIRLAGMAVRGIGQVLCSAQTLGQMPAAQAEIKSILRESHRIPEGDDDDFTIRNQTDIAATAEETTRTMTILLASIASISLLVGGIG
ncbi:MAG TPA: ABC transporter permease, partial [Candidatus Aminicenantes bacterium]|nr:ABC transporter permease [Candidatus Aminicenantes bacterium]